MFIGLVLLAIGVIALLIKLEVLTGSIWGYFWPVLLILLGLSFLFGRRRLWHWCGWRRWPSDEEEKR